MYLCNVCVYYMYVINVCNECICVMYVCIVFLCMCIFFHSLYCVSRAMHVYGFRHMCDLKLVSVAINTFFPAVTSLNQYRLRTVLHILLSNKSDVSNFNDTNTSFLKFRFILLIF